MTRADLLALNHDVLVALANRGLVKRAAKEIDAGVVPDVSADEDGTVRGRFADGVEVVFPVGAGLDSASCTCPATGVCRHRIGLVLAYQSQAAQEPSEDRTEDPAGDPTGGWSPGSVADEELQELLGTRAMNAARRRLAAGYSVHLDRGGPDEPAPRADLATCTVRFLVPGELGYAHTDAAGPNRAEAIALAVWAFREADGRGLGEREIRLDVGGGPTPRAERTGIEPAVELATELLVEGAMHAGPVLGAALRRMQRTIDDQGLHWPAGALDDLADQLDAYAARGARYEATRYATLLAELHARQRAAAGSGLRSQVLGGDEPGQTPLRRVRLVGLGCRVGGTLDERVADVYFAHAGDGTVLVLRRRWEQEPDRPVTGHDLSGRRVAGASLGALAAANLVSESASRSASRVVKVAPGRIAKTTVTPVGAAWERLPGAVMVRDLAAAARALEELPPRLIRPRIEAEFVRVVQVAEVRDVGYHPGDQRLEAVVADPAGSTVTVSAEYRAECPGALDALAGALDDGPAFISGSLHRGRGTLVLDPIAVMTSKGMVVPDLAAGEGETGLSPYAGRSPDPLGAALDTALTTLAEVAHRGLRHATPGVHTRIEEAATDLGRVGLRRSATMLTAFVAACRSDLESAPGRWVDAQLQLVTAADLR
ncbi:hypothetical protein [Actinomadura sp. DC4]|uniref:hypothetical protein n=1 Tax=Actinomadura sp. DC4 TaxID=3055069 RepID=UPI0025B0AB6C|nr:hypothetical protein [Actinomadura sp. DC4]MDN3351517.1 hypothetical protein [Actinomadura sp. DC4]